MKRITATYLNKVYLQLQKKQLINSLVDLNLFYDEPKPYQYSIALNFPNEISDGTVDDGIISATGISFNSPEHALLKCIFESIERCSTCIFDKNDIVFNSFLEFQKNSISALEIEDNSRIGWVEMDNVCSSSSMLIPAQLVYYNFMSSMHEPFIFEPIGTGAAAGFNSKEIITNGILEIVERDAFITSYLIKAPIKRIDIDTIESSKLQNIFSYLQDYQFELHIFDITNDLEIPVIMSILIDKTSLGPAVSVGLKCSFNMEDNILESIGEVLTTRIWLRKKVLEDPSLITKTKPRKVRTLLDRGLYWYPVSSINNINYLFMLPKQPLQVVNTPEYQYEHIVDLLKSKNYNILVKDITPNLFKEICKVVKVIVPEVQPLYLDEKSKEIKKERIKQTMRYYKQNKYKLYDVPHPFL